MKALIHGREIKRIIEEAWYPDAYYKVEVEPIYQHNLAGKAADKMMKDLDPIEEEGCQSVHPVGECSACRHKIEPLRGGRGDSVWGWLDEHAKKINELVREHNKRL